MVSSSVAGMSLLTYILLFFTSVSASPVNDLVVTTTSGTFEGFYPHKTVRAFLGIPFAKPAVGPLRFSPPEPLVSTNKSVLDATKFGNTCYQFRYKTIGFERQGPTTGESEDCLTINVWGSAHHKGKELRPSLIWVYGGGFGEGASSDFIYNPLELIKAHQDIIFVSFNYRLNVFGFPFTPALPPNSTNLGLRDQRLALEWLRDNISSFGGDPKRMTMFGQSAGAISIAVHSFWRSHDPIVQAMIMQSGQAEGGITNTPDEFIRVANQTGCLNVNRSAELDCLRSLDPVVLRNGVSKKPYNYFAEPFGGATTVDNVTFFSMSDYIQKGMKGQFAKIPYLMGTANNEGDGLVPFTPDKGVNRTFADEQTLGVYTCLSSLSAGYRAASGVPVWRYRYMGSFPWQTTFPWLAGRTPHGSEITLLFGTQEAAKSKDLTKNDLAAISYLQNAWVSFAKDPYAGLSSLGWPRYNSENNTLIEIFPGNKAGVEIVDPAKYDTACKGLKSIDTSGYGPYCEGWTGDF